MKIAAWHYFALFLAGMGLAQAEGCPNIARINPTGASAALNALYEAFIHAPSHGAACGSLASVLNKLTNRGTTGGRRLEKDKPLDPTEAQANLDAALQDPEIRTRIEKVRSEIKDENVRLVYEAAIFDEEGYYNARELIIQWLRQKLN